MDLNGRNRIQEALDSGLRTAGQPRFFSIEPDEYELIGGEEASEDAVEAVRFVDIHTRTDPCRVLECLRNAHILEQTGSDDLMPQTPKLRLLGMTANRIDTVTLTFEDLAQR